MPSDGQRRRVRRAPSLDVVVGDARGRRVRVTGLSAWLQRVAPAQARGSLSIALVGDGAPASFRGVEAQPRRQWTAAQGTAERVSDDDVDGWPMGGTNGGSLVVHRHQDVRRPSPFVFENAS